MKHSSGSMTSPGLRRPTIPEESGLLYRLGGRSWALIGCALALAVIGGITVHSASSELSVDYLPRQVVWVFLGVAVAGLALLVGYHALLRLSVQAYGVGLVAVALILLFGHEAGGARSWIGIAGLGGQPSDFMRAATALLLARYLGAIKQSHLELRQVAVSAAIVAVPMLLVALQPDYGGAAMFLPIYGAMMLVAGVRFRLAAAITVALLVLGGGIWTSAMQDFQRERILSFLYPERDPLGSGYQVRQSKIAVGSGEALGKGYLQGTQSHLRFLPARHTDFIFAVLAEERGFAGVVVCLFLYLLYLRSGLEIAVRARDRAGVLLVAGFLGGLSGHVLYNTAMVIGLLPVTGIPLPFLSYGGSFTLFCFLATGLMVAVDYRRYVNR